MTKDEPLLFRFFDPLAEFDVTERDLPHWAQAGTMCFITWRTFDSMPGVVVNQWHADRVAWLSKHGIDVTVSDWKSKIPALDKPSRQEYYRLFSARWQKLLDDCLGSCPLRKPDLAKIVADSLLFFDGDRYTVTDFVTMPNHVHLLVIFPSPDLMLKQCESWKYYTATQINRKLGRKGHFWETDAFDHLVRSEEQWQRLREYIAQNPVQAKLQPGEYIHYSRQIK
jgi:putative transposase